MVVLRTKVEQAKRTGKKIPGRGNSKHNGGWWRNSTGQWGWSRASGKKAGKGGKEAVGTREFHVAKDTVFYPKCQCRISSRDIGHLTYF